VTRGSAQARHDPAPRLSYTLRPALPADRPRVTGLRRQADLPLDGIPDDLEGFLVAQLPDGRVCAAGGLERHGTTALLRSTVVDPSCRACGVGGALVAELLRRAESSGALDVVLLTTTAQAWFPRFGFERIAWSDVPSEALGSAEFRGACPQTAVVMRKRVGERE